MCKHSVHSVVIPYACNTDTPVTVAVTAASVVRTQLWPTAANWQFGLSDPKMPIKWLVIADWFKLISGIIASNKQITWPWIWCLFWYWSLGRAGPGRIGTGTIVTCSTGTSGHAMTKSLPCALAVREMWGKRKWSKRWRAVREALVIASAVRFPSGRELRGKR